MLRVLLRTRDIWRRVSSRKSTRPLRSLLRDDRLTTGKKCPTNFSLSLDSLFASDDKLEFVGHFAAQTLGYEPGRKNRYRLKLLVEVDQRRVNRKRIDLGGERRIQIVIAHDVENVTPIRKVWTPRQSLEFFRNRWHQIE